MQFKDTMTKFKEKWNNWVKEYFYLIQQYHPLNDNNQAV